MLNWLQNSAPSLLLQRSGTVYLLINALHIGFLGTLVGSITALDLRLLGVFKTIPLPAMGTFLSRYAAVALLLAIITGVLLFSVQPHDYSSNIAFRIKLALIAAGIANALWLHGSRTWKLGLQQTPIPIRIRAHAAVSLFIWPATLVAGRWIAFV